MVETLEPALGGNVPEVSTLEFVFCILLEEDVPEAGKLNNELETGFDFMVPESPIVEFVFAVLDTPLITTGVGTALMGVGSDDPIVENKLAAVSKGALEDTIPEEGPFEDSIAEEAKELINSDDSVV